MTIEQYWEVGTEMDKSDNLWILKDRYGENGQKQKSEEKNERLWILHKQF